MARRIILWTAALGLLAFTASAEAAGISNPSLVLRPKAFALPPPGATVTDPTFGTHLRRLSATSARGSFETQLYSQLQAFSDDERFVLLDSPTGYRLRRVGSGARVSLTTSDWNAPRWDPAAPHSIYHYDSNADANVRLLITNVATGATKLAFAFPRRYTHIMSNQSFDELSRNGRWIAGMASIRGGDAEIFALDLVRRRLAVTKDLDALYSGPCTPDPQWGQVEPDWLAPSPLGSYLVIQWPADGTDRCHGLESFSLRNGAFAGRAYDGHQHGDMGVDAAGREFFMTFELYHPSGSLALGIRYLPGTPAVAAPHYLRTFAWEIGGHISCQGRIGGPCLVSAGVDKANGWQPFEGELFLQYLDGTVLRLVHHRSSSCGYWAQPRATLSASGRYVAYASDWGRGVPQCEGSEPVDPYLLDVPSRGTAFRR